MGKGLLLALVTATALAGCSTVVRDSAASGTPSAVGETAFASNRIVVTTQGSGPDVILIPGLSSSPKVWAGTIAAVPGYRYHLVQVKGFAGVPAEANATGNVAAPAAAEIARYIRENRIARPAVIGHSMGGTIGMMLAARNPGAVGKLMVVDMLPFLGAMFAPGATVESVRPIAEQMRAGMNAPPSPAGDAMLTNIINGMVNTVGARAPVLADSRASDRGTSGNSYYELVTTDLTPELARITVPMRVLFVRPAAAPMTDAQMEAIYGAAYRNAPSVTLARVPDSAHFVMIDQPARFQDEVRGFLK